MFTISYHNQLFDTIEVPRLPSPLAPLTPTKSQENNGSLMHEPKKKKITINLLV